MHNGKKDWDLSGIRKGDWKSMSRRVSGWICLVASVLFVSQACLAPAWSAEGARGEPVAAGRDSGEPVSGRGGSRSSSNIWGWVAGAAIIVVGGIVGYLLGEETQKDKDDAEDAAEDAQAAAAAAAASADAAAGAGEETTFGYSINITGTFTAAGPVSPGFTPSMTFAVQTSSFPGGIVDYVDSATGAASGRGGEWSQVDSMTIMITVQDGFYLGKAKVYASQGNYSITLMGPGGNNTVLYATPGARVLLVRNPPAE